MKWKDIDPDRRRELIERLARDAQVFLANAKISRVDTGREYFECQGDAYSAAAEALLLLAEESDDDRKIG